MTTDVVGPTGEPRGSSPTFVPTADSSPPRIAETHSAWVVFLGDRAYKIKKPIRLEFLDFSTAKRANRTRTVRSSSTAGSRPTSTSVSPT